MSLEAVLQSFGIGKVQVVELASTSYFHHKKKSREEFESLFDTIAKTYSCSQAEVIKAILTHPPFAGYNHERVIREATKVYGTKNEENVKKVILQES